MNGNQNFKNLIRLNGAKIITEQVLSLPIYINLNYEDGFRIETNIYKEFLYFLLAHVHKLQIYIYICTLNRVY